MSAPAAPLAPAPGRPPAHDHFTRATAAAPVAADAPASVPWPASPSLAFAAWGIGSAAALGWLLLAAGRMRRLALRGTEVDDPRWRALLDRARLDAGITRPIRLVATPHDLLLATWGSRHPRVVIPTCALGWSDARVRTVLAHEVAHIVRHDWLLQTVAEVLRGLLWWNPLAWFACRALRHDSELACDDAVLRAGVGPTAYAEDLLQIARLVAPAARSAAPVAMRMARTSTLERRIVAMLNPTLDRRLPSRRALAGAAVAVATLLLPVTLLRAGQSARQPLEGVVYDTSGAVLPGIAVVLDADAAKVETTTDPAGRFRFDGVEPGQHALQVSAPGFRPLKQPIQLRHDADWNRAVTLQIGDLRETVAVSARRPATLTPLTDPGSDGRTRVRVGGNIRAPRKTHNVPPVYPSRMVEAGVEGQVSVEAVIGVDGRVVRARPSTVQAHPELAQAAVDAVRQWRFDPTLLNGAPVEVLMNVSVDFSLQ
jgi:TonB family protein